MYVHIRFFKYFLCHFEHLNIYIFIPQPIILLYLFQPFDLYFTVQKTFMMINNKFVHINLKIMHWLFNNQ